jgi:hypothetical protein
MGLVPGSLYALRAKKRKMLCAIELKTRKPVYFGIYAICWRDGVLRTLHDAGFVLL